MCDIGIQTIMQSDHGPLHNQNKLKILRLIFIPSVQDSSWIAVEILKFDRKQEKSLSQKCYVLTISLWSKWQLSKLFVNKRYLARDHVTWVGIQVCFAHAGVKNYFT